ncbi:unnamed protein product, partial [Musa hybrid cultivar]
MLASTTGRSGKALRQEISEIVFTISNIREILQYGESHVMLQKLGIETLTSFAMEEEARERIGSTGGMIKELLWIFFREGLTQLSRLKKAATRQIFGATRFQREEGEQGRKGRKRKGRRQEQRRETVHNHLAMFSSQVRSNLPALAVITWEVLDIVVNAMMTAEMKLLEVSLGLATQVFRFMDAGVLSKQLEQLGTREEEFAERLVQILEEYNHPSAKVPR